MYLFVKKNFFLLQFKNILNEIYIIFFYYFIINKKIFTLTILNNVNSLYIIIFEQKFEEVK